ncbi:hypothetical protein PFAG_03912 [Plasmodium falciparum Santa Lucia]|uniref:Uncharacterized protein n=7 Tax=Plasmodium falciparum TaxID=5833 RepID=Q8I5F7_PLAF7|nr:conserved protein, unknown function [Plasmodium falciparum 3D7]ETW15006.1 hypothetical protein PFFVO_06083 [Plasmodium falciparum Vietnam Oak-Knoll (FVO)]ETW55943.1 hypothetical protein PFUGPA_01987 [Plasmodium falciparum Palo Alto/Uganda]ETW60292.1 hypothetical protein PFMC_03835 [Plasmodium falciparum CAMP/Malaysia]EUR67990.1 hypothetical protein PFBG_03955 [Plasmodium falciparum 7G8]EUT82537.1 hypothetical protein PFAG_03912 [Plasmodium falciparum Santa Lucia]EWC87403.1 hypothetical pro|eukprot:XP_001350657.1 conserved Plasmodium protein, unknown function [Plasmodium falciparum 3D7]
MKVLNFPFMLNKRSYFSIYNFFISLRKGGESTLKNDIKHNYIKELLTYEKEKRKMKKKITEYDGNNISNKHFNEYLKDMEEKIKTHNDLISDDENNKKVKHLIKMNKTEGGIRIKCSTSLIYMLSLKCRYIESIWLNVAKNKKCNSLNCLRDILLNIEWNKYIHYEDLKYIPLKIICTQSTLFDISNLKNEIYKYINEVILMSQGDQNILSKVEIIKNIKNNINSEYSYDHLVTSKKFIDTQNDIYSDDHIIVQDNNCFTTTEKINIENNLKNIWNLLSVHIHNNICNVDIKFTGKLSPRFYQYVNMKELKDIPNIEKYENINFSSLFYKNPKINDEKIKNIVNQTIPHWSVCEEKKKIQIDYEKEIKMDKNNDDIYYKYNYFLDPYNKKLGVSNDNVHRNIYSSLIKKETINNNLFSLNDEQLLLKKETFEKNKNRQNNNYDNNNNVIHYKNPHIIGDQKENKTYNLEADLSKHFNITKHDMINYLNDLELRRMIYYNNNFFLSDDSYDSSSCIYSLIIKKCLHNKKNINIIWDPFCSTGNLIFELLSYLLNIPLYNQDEIVPFMNLKIYNHHEFLNIYNYNMKHLINNYSNIHIIGSDNRDMMILQCKKYLIRYALYYKKILKYIKDKNKNEITTQKDIHIPFNTKNYTNLADYTRSNYIKKNSFLKNVLKEDLETYDGVDSSTDDMNDLFYETSPWNFSTDMDELRKVKEENIKNKNSVESIRNKNILNSSNHRTILKNAEKNVNTSDQCNDKINAPDMDIISISTEEDKKYNINLPFDVSFHKAHFFNLSPFIKNAIIITKIPHFNFCKELGVNKKTFMLYEQFDQMLCSKNDWEGVYVLIRNKTFLNKSKLEWNKVLSIKDSKGRFLTLLSWTGRKKNLYSLNNEYDKLKELEKFSEKLKFDI